MKRLIPWTLGCALGLTLSGCPDPILRWPDSGDTAPPCVETQPHDPGVGTLGAPQTFYLDYDGDGYGDDARALQAWQAPSPYVGVGGDCQDTVPQIHPGAEEVCDGADNDCDGSADDEDPEVLDQRTWHCDGDADGYGDADWSVLACDQPDGAVEDATDCDDGDAQVHPEAVERCGDGEDDDCDGEVDEGAVCACQPEIRDDQAYWFCTDALTWTEAASSCAANGYGLVAVQDQDENDWLAETALELSPEEQWFICADDRVTEGAWMCDAEPVTYTNFDEGEPNGGASESCAILIPESPWSGAWNDGTCDVHALGYICEDR